MKIILKSIAAVSIAMALFIVTSCDDSDNNIPSVKVTSMEIGDENGNKTITLIVGDSKATVVKVTPDEAVDKNEYNFRFSSSNETICIVDDNGMITAMGAGEAVVRADAVNNSDMWTVCIVKVEARTYPVTDITIPDEYKNFYMGINKSFDLSSKITVNPDNATEPSLIYSSDNEMVATINEFGEIQTYMAGDVKFTIKAIDGSTVEAECNVHVRNTIYTDFIRTGWTVTTSHPYAADGTVNGSPESLIDDSSLTSCLSLVKPGKMLGNISVPADDIVYFIIDMQGQKQFDFFRLRHRTNNTSANLRVTKVSVYGSNDNINFEEILSGISISGSINEVTVDLPASKYQYFKMTYDGWNASGNTMQISDFNIGKLEYEN